MIKFILFSFLAASISQAYEGFRCIPSLRETRFQVLVQDQEIQVRVTNPMGYDLMPQFDGPNSVFNISFNQMQGDDLKDLGESFTYSWPKESCKLDSDAFTVNCRDEAKTVVKAIKSFGLTTTEVTERYEGETFEKRKFRFSLEKENIYFVTLMFDAKTCLKF